MKEILLSFIQTKSTVQHWMNSEEYQSNRGYTFHMFLYSRYKIIEYGWDNGDDRLRIKTETPEQLTWFLLSI